MKKVKKFLCSNGGFYFFLVFLFFLFNVKLPYYIEATGGLINVLDRIKIEDAYISEGSFNMAYVKSMDATIPTVIATWLNPNWDLISKKEVVLDKETEKESDLRNHILLNEASTSATVVAYRKAKKPISIKKTEIYVIYVDKNAKTNLKIGDQILKIDGKEIIDTDSIKEILQNHNIGDELEIEVQNKKIQTKKATIYREKDQKMIGIMIGKKYDVTTTPKITFSFPESESGSSGGLMTTLAIYNALIEEDLTHGLKVAGTGTIDMEGNVGSIDGVKYKLKGVVDQKADIFFVPNGSNYKEAISLQKKYHYPIDIVGVSTFDEAVSYLQKIKA